MAKAGHADAYKQLPFLEKGQHPKVVTLQNTPQAAWDGSIPNTQLCSSAAAVLHYNCFVEGAGVAGLQIPQDTVRGMSRQL